MKILDEALNGVILLEPVMHEDHRGFFLESYNQSVMEALGIDFYPCQDNHSLSKHAGTLRGLHFQFHPYAQAKLVRVLRGAIYDVVVDIRPSSPTFQHWRGYELSTENRRFLYVSVGFAHGFCTLQPDTEVFYKVDKPYSIDHEAGILWSDPSLAIDWPSGDKVVSDKDTRHRTLSEWQESGSFVWKDGMYTASKPE
jgi:dTDP-4-dehydrorhamnose 3,5-epimerase